MNKKIVGFVLAMCLCLGLGVNSLFADSRYGLGKNYGSGYGESVDLLAGGTNSANSNTGTNDNYVSRRAEYRWGLLFFNEDKTTNTKQYVDGTTTKVRSDGTESVQKFSVGKADYNEIIAMGQGSFEKNFYLWAEKRMGVSEKQLQHTLANGEQGSVAWFKALETELKLGHNCNIDITASGGASLTLCDDAGKPQITINHAGVSIEKYNYNPDTQTLESIDSISLKKNDEKKDIQSKDENASKYIVGGYEYTRVYMDEFGRQSYSVKLDMSGYKDANGNQRTDLSEDEIKNAPTVKDSNGNTIIYNTWHYTTNNTVDYTYDHIQKQTTKYKDGRPDEVLNDANRCVAKYHYLDDNSLSYVENFNWSKDDNGNLKQTSTGITFYDHGDELGTMSLTELKKNEPYKSMSNDEIVNKARAGIADLKKNGADSSFIKDPIYSAISQIKIKGVDLLNSNKFRTFVETRLNDGAKTVKEALAKDNGSSDVMILKLAQTTEPTTGASKDKSVGIGGNVYFSDGGSDKSGTKGKQIYSKLVNIDVLKAGGTIHFYLDKDGNMVSADKKGEDGVSEYTLSEKGGLVGPNGKINIKCSVEDFANYIGSNMSASTFKSKTGINPNGNPKIKVYSQKSFSESSYFNIDIAGEKLKDIEGEYKYLLQDGDGGNKTYKHGDNVGKQTYTTYTADVLDRGQFSHDVTSSGVKDNETITKGVNLDPHVVGSYQGLETSKDGKHYLIMNSTEINMMDGTNYQSTNGEVFKVEIDEETFQALQAKEASGEIKKGDKMSAGVDLVSKDKDGYVVRLNQSYTTKADMVAAIQFGDSNVEAAKRENTENANVSGTWQNNNTITNTALSKYFGNATGMKLADEILKHPEEVADIMKNF